MAQFEPGRRPSGLEAMAPTRILEQLHVAEPLVTQKQFDWLQRHCSKVAEVLPKLQNDEFSEQLFHASHLPEQAAGWLLDAKTYTKSYKNSDYEGQPAMHEDSRSPCT